MRYVAENKEDCHYGFENFSNNSIVKSWTPEYLKNLNKRAKRAFFMIYNEELNEGIDWKTSEFVGVSIRGFNISSIFSYNGIKYVIYLDDCLPSKRGWLMTDDPRWKGEYSKIQK